MPAILRFEGFRVAIYPNDHRPPHVHVIGKGYEAVFNLNCPEGPVALRENYGFPRRDAGRIERGLGRNLARLCEAWEEIHGNA